MAVDQYDDASMAVWFPTNWLDLMEIFTRLLQLRFGALAIDPPCH